MIKTTVSIEGAEFFAYHGYFEEERLAGNHFILDVSVDLETQIDFDDRISDTINYSDLYSLCEEEMKNTQKLLETVVNRIITRIGNDLKGVLSARVKLSKINPQMGGKVNRACVEMRF